MANALSTCYNYGVKAITFATVLIVAAVFLVWPATLTPAGPASLLETNILFAIYGRGFGIAPILGHLGTYKDIESMAVDTQPSVRKIAAIPGSKNVITGIDLVYALAIPCGGSANCLLHADTGLVDKYIQPAAARGWTVILDTQIGRSDPLTEVKRMIDRGYLKFENVHVALDPEYHSVPGHETPGIPVGTVTAGQVNDVQDLLNRYVDSEHLKTKKILIVHQFGDAAVHDRVPYMIADKTKLKEFPKVDLVIDADGLGEPAEKIRRYNLMTNRETYPAVHFTGLKVFFPNQWEKAGHFDKPPLTIEQIFGLTPVPNAPKMLVKPNVLIVA